MEFRRTEMVEAFMTMHEPARGPHDAGESHRARLAIVANSPAPFRNHLHRRIANEMQEVELWSVYTHEMSSAEWSESTDPATRPICFGKGERAEQQAAPLAQWHEWRKGGRIIRWLRRQQIDAVLIHGYNDAGRLRIIRWCSALDIPCLLFGDSNIRGDTAKGLKAWLKHVYVGWVVRHCTGLLPCGSLGRDYFLKYGAQPTRIHYFPCEPDYLRIQALEEDKSEEVRNRYGFAKNRRRLLFCGRLVGLKRVDLLIDAFTAIAAERPSWDLVIVGDGPLKAGLQARVPTELKDRVQWLGFVVDQEILGAIYRACDVLVLPSERDAWALVINEAASAGLAIVSSDVVGAAAELVREAVNGAVFPSGDLQALTRVLAAVTHPDQIERLKAGSHTVLAEWRAFADPVDGLRQALRSVFSSALQRPLTGRA